VPVEVTALKEVRVAAYCRFSSLNQKDGFSIEAQHLALEKDGVAWRASHGERWTITWYDEPARSARRRSSPSAPSSCA
jgi:hypothetical protein